MKRLILIFLSLAALSPAFADNKVPDNSTRKERNYIRQGNSLYNEKRFSEAEVAYRKALEENAASETAMYNLATSLIRQAEAPTQTQATTRCRKPQAFCKTSPNRLKTHQSQKKRFTIWATWRSINNNMIRR